MTYIPPVGNFGPYPVQVTLDGNGNGAVSFQPSGRNVRITRLYVSVATQVKQASVTIYRGQVGTSNGLGTIVSGSTGGLATGQIDLTDGQQLFVQWSGGDAGAVATATFDGNAISLAEIGNDSITWADPIAAADGTLIFPAIKSSNYVTGVSGWMIDRQGDAEFNGGTFRGEVDVNGTDGSKVAIFASGGHAEIDLTPPTYIPSTLVAIPSTIGAGSNGSGNGAFSTLDLDSGEVFQQTPFLSSTRSFISLQSSTLDHTFGSTIILSANNIQLGTGVGKITVNDSVSPIPGSWVAGAALTANSGGIAATETVILTATNAAGTQPTFLASHYYRFTVEGQAQTTSTSVGPIFGIRKTNAAGTRYKWARQNTTTLGNPYAAHVEGEFQVGPSGQAADIVLTLQGAAGQTVTAIAATDNPLILNIYDMGPTPLQKTLYLPVL